MAVAELRTLPVVPRADCGRRCDHDCRHHLGDAGCVLAHVEANPDGMTLEQVGAAFGVTRERIRQIEKQAIAKLRRTARHLDDGDRTCTAKCSPSDDYLANREAENASALEAPDQGSVPFNRGLPFTSESDWRAGLRDLWERRRTIWPANDTQRLIDETRAALVDRFGPVRDPSLVDVLAGRAE